ncbi:hypothetical protein [Niabella ginsengisoli]|uniref:Tetratricopeptide repeat protein n=1 Tax=Niabella ginsengisoli TaxID=522298 RepID=A0ABS9SIM6_9BACT|nr:hypothetical protein [Niabella ginsengisoli]MCH5598218.1 hypothetical protein [Niabella ginsengisoli]
MKKVILLATIAAFSTAGAYAQKYEDIKGALALGQTDKAKEAFDKNSTNEKFFTKPEGHILKAAVFASLAVDSSKAAEAEKNRTEADAALAKYKEMEPDMKLLEDPMYKNAPYNLYAAYFNAGINDINSKAYEPAFEKFKKTVDYSELLIAKKIMNKQMDTAAVYYTGLLAENTKHEEDALKYYTRIADAKIKDYNGTSYESVYQGLVRHYATKNDNANFEKYKALGKELYPQSEFFTYSMLDFAVGSSSNFNERLASLEKLLAASPEDYKANITLAEIIYDTLDSRKEGAVMPGNAAELETKMLAALNKASSLKPEEMQPYLLLGDHYQLKAGNIRNEMVTAETEVTKKGAKATAADKQKVADIKKSYNEAYDIAKTNYEKAAEMFAKMPSLDATQKRTYRLIAGNIAEYYSYKIEDAKAADRDKFVALEKKWDDIFVKLR